jgi:hypothetical protein
MRFSPRPGEYPGAADSIVPDYLPHPVLRLDSPATSGSGAAHSGPPRAYPRKPSASRAESNRNSLFRSASYTARYPAFTSPRITSSAWWADRPRRNPCEQSRKSASNIGSRINRFASPVSTRRITPSHSGSATCSNEQIYMVNTFQFTRSARLSLVYQSSQRSIFPGPSGLRERENLFGSGYAGLGSGPRRGETGSFIFPARCDLLGTTSGGQSLGAAD